MGSRYQIIFLAFTSAIALGAASSAPAAASAEAPQTVTEIIVTAERSGTNLQQTPVAVATVNDVEAREKGLQNLNDLSGRVAGFYSPGARGTRSSGAFYIRGLGEGSAINAQAVSVYLDDIYLPRPQGGGLDLIDIEQVEVLRGPQGTLYGRNSSAGSVVVRTRKPGDDLRISAQAEVGNFSQRTFRGAVSGPIVKDTLFGSLSFVRNKRDGFYYSPLLDRDEMGIDDTLVYGKLRFIPNDKLELALSVDYDWDKSGPLTQQPRPGLPAPFFAYPAAYKPWVVYNNYPTFNDFKGGGISLVATWKPSDNDTIKSISSARQFDQEGLYDSDGTPQDRVRIASDFEDLAYAQELQWLHDGGRIRSVGGLYLSRERFGSTRATTAGGFLGLPTTTASSVAHVTSLAAYAQVGYDLTDAAKITVGGRYTRDRHSFTDTLWSNTREIYSITVPHRTDGVFTPKISLDYRWSPSLFTYVSVSTGTRSGGYDNNATSIQAASTGFKPEVVRSYEAGLKSDLLGNRLRTNIAAFYNDLTDLQSAVRDPATTNSIRVNVGSAYSRGVELENTAVLFEGLEWTNSVSFTETKIRSFKGDPTKVGNQLANAPKWLVNSWLSYTATLANAASLKFGLGYQHASSSFTDISNIAQVRIPSSSNWDGSVTFVAPDEHLSVALVVTNLTDKARITGANYVAPPIAFSTYVLSPPRQWSLRLRYEY